VVEVLGDVAAEAPNGAGGGFLVPRDEVAPARSSSYTTWRRACGNARWRSRRRWGLQLAKHLVRLIPVGSENSIILNFRAEMWIAGRMSYGSSRR